MDRRQFCKNAGINIVNRGRARRNEAICQKRAENRMDILKSRRKMDDIPTVSTANKENQRAEMLAKWKAQKQKTLADLKKSQKPVFKIGILQRKVTGSPVIKMSSSYAIKNFLNPSQLSKVNKCKMHHDGVVTRAKSKNMQDEIIADKGTTKFSQIVNNKKKEIKNHAFNVPSSVAALTKSIKVTLPQIPVTIPQADVSKSKRKIREENIHSKTVSQERNFGNNKESGNINDQPKNDSEEVKNILKTDRAHVTENMKEFTLLKSEAKINEERELKICEKEEKENSPITKHVLESENDFVPIHFSPYVKKSRGSEIKSPRRKIDLFLDVDKLIEKEENEFRCRIFSFRKYIECETKRLLDMCEKWKRMTGNREKIPADVESEILSLCGKTNLLTSDKFMQFKDLIDKCENKDPMIKVEDLQGYQDWVSIDVESLIQSFTKLEEKKEHEWKENIIEPVASFTKKEKKPLPSRKPMKFQGVKSNIREHILAVRKLKQSGVEVCPFNADSIIQTSTPKKENSLLKDVLSCKANTSKNSVWNVQTPKVNSTEKRRVSGMEIIAATHLAKSLTPFKKSVNITLEDHKTSFSEACTPLKSILKQTPGSIAASKHNVQFKLNSGFDNEMGLNEKYFEPAQDEEDCSELSIRTGDFTLTSPTQKRAPNITSTLIRRSARLARK